MGLCESMRGWRWQGSGAALRAGVGVLLLGLSLAQSVPPHTACPAAAAPHSLSQPQYQDTAGEDTIVGFMAPLVQSFLQAVQPNPFPKGQCRQYYSLSKHPEPLMHRTLSTYSQTLFEDIYLAHRATRRNLNHIEILWLACPALSKICPQDKCDTSHLTFRSALKLTMLIQLRRQDGRLISKLMGILVFGKSVFNLFAPLFQADVCVASVVSCPSL